jgi:hypothetical protein
MKYTYIAIFLTGMLLVAPAISSAQQKHAPVDLQDRWDTTRPLENPDKGWFHHHNSGRLDRYPIHNDSLARVFPGMDHLYIRLSWAFFEPREGQYFWKYFDDLVEKYGDMGYGLGIHITSKERGGYPVRMPQRVDGVNYATPYWVRQAGAEGTVVEDARTGGQRSWAPDWDDPVYLEKLSNFHEAFAERYDGEPWLRYVDIGSIGDYGEGHTNPSTGIPPTKEEVKSNLDIFLKHYKETQIIASDALLFWNKPDSVVQDLLDYAVSNGISIRDNSPLVEWHIDTYTDTWSVSHPHFYERVYRDHPTVFEMQHYSAVKEDGHWLGKNGRDTIPDLGVSGADIFRNAMKLIHPTYISYHGWMDEWYNDNPDLTDELLNLVGYWYFPKTFQLQQAGSSSVSFTIEWLNKGVAPAYNHYQLKGKLTKVGDPEDVHRFEIDDSGNRSWMPGRSSSETYSIPNTGSLSGEYQLSVQLVDQRSGRPVEMGLQTEYRDKEGYYKLSTIILE